MKVETRPPGKAEDDETGLQPVMRVGERSGRSFAMVSSPQQPPFDLVRPQDTTGRNLADSQTLTVRDQGMQRDTIIMIPATSVVVATMLTTIRTLVTHTVR